MCQHGDKVGQPWAGGHSGPFPGKRFTVQSVTQEGSAVYHLEAGHCQPKDQPRPPSGNGLETGEQWGPI